MTSSSNDHRAPLSARTVICSAPAVNHWLWLFRGLSMRIARASLVIITHSRVDKEAFASHVFSHSAEEKRMNRKKNKLAQRTWQIVTKRLICSHDDTFNAAKWREPAHLGTTTTSTTTPKGMTEKRCWSTHVSCLISFVAYYNRTLRVVVGKMLLCVASTIHDSINYLRIERRFLFY